MKKSFFTPLILIAVILPTILPYFNSRFFYTQDYIFIARLQQMSTALFSGHFPVRWAPDLRYGEPLFNFYAPLPYYAGSLINFTGINILWTAKILFILGVLFSAGSMYLTGKKLFGQKGGIMAAVLYTYAPYKALDLYVRGSLSETWAFIFFPLIFLTSILIAEKLSIKNFILFTLSLAGLFLTHNVTTLMFLPFLGLWWIYLTIREKKWKIILRFAAGCIFALALSAFYLLPAFFERSLIQTKYLIVGYFNFRAHFVAVKQFFSIFWGYGSSVWGLEDGLSFQIGLTNLAVVLLAGVIAVYKREKKYLLFFFFIASAFVFSVFLQHNKSAFIWEAIPSMAFIQFPWRFLGITIFICALAGASVVPYLKNRKILLFYCLILVSILSTVFYFKPKEYADDSFFRKFLSVNEMRRGADLTKDYLPVWVQTVEGERFDEPRADSGEIRVENFKKSSTRLNFSLNALTDSTIELPVTYFPDWAVMLNNQIISQVEPSKMGLIRFKAPQGQYEVKAQLRDTPVRIAGNMISLGSFLLLAGLLAHRKVRK